MKKLLLKSTAFLLCSISLSSQAQEWKKNSAHTALYALDQFGGTNITGIGIGIVNPTARLEVFGRIKFHSTLMLDSTLNIGSNYSINGLNGSFKNASWASASNRFMQVDANGSLIPFPVGSPSQVLYGNGTWGALPVVPVIWQQAGSVAYYNNGFVGIGTSNPQAALDVVGDVKVSNNLYVGGGILISQKVEASSSMKTDTVHSTSGETKFTAKLMLLDKMQVEGATLLKSQFQVNGTSLFNGTVQANNLNVSGVTNFGNGAIVNGVLTTNTLNVNGSFMANTLNIGTAANNVDLKVQTDANGATTLGFGYRSAGIPAGATSCVAPPVAGVTASFFGRAVITTPNANVTTEPTFDFRNTATNGTIDYGFDYIQYPQPTQRVGPSPIPSIKINGSCWGDVELAKGGGFVSTGTHFEVGNPVSSYLIASNILANNRIGQRVTLNTNIPDATILTSPQLTNYNTQLFVNKNLTRALSVFNAVTNTNGDEVFTVFGDGKTVIGDNRMPVGYQLAVKGKIIAEEVVVQLSSTWPDYVFAKNYNLKPLSEIESYIKEHNHLQNIPSAKEIEKEGVTLGTIVTKQMEKIEELTLYLIEQQKQIEELKKLVDSIKK